MTTTIGETVQPTRRRPVRGHPAAHGLLLIAAFGLAACAGGPPSRVTGDGGPARPPAELADLPDAVPQHAPRSRYGNPPSYEVFGVTYYVMDSVPPRFEEEGRASWYGEKFHGRRTSSGEPYDMYAMTAAHRSLPLPTWVEVTNLENNRSVVVKVNDRGPFVDTDQRIIDLSYAAAVRLDMHDRGTAPVRIRVVTPDDPPRMAAGESRGTPAASLPPPSEVIPAREEPAEKEAEETEEADRAATAPSGAEQGVDAVARAAAASSPSRGTRDEAPVEIGTAEPIISASAEIAPVNLYLQVGAFAGRDNAERMQAHLHETLQTPVTIDNLERDGRALYRVRLGPLQSVADADRLGEQLESKGIDTFLVAP